VDILTSWETQGVPYMTSHITVQDREKQRGSERERNESQTGFITRYVNIKSRRMRWAGHVARIGKKRNAYRILVRKPGGKRSLGRPTRRWVDNIKIGLREIGWDGMDWVDLAQDRDQWRSLVNLRIP
jgi:hypothetical protein